MPRDAMDMEDMHFTPEQMQQMDRQMLAGGTERWTLAVREAASGKLVGYTETLRNSSRPLVVRQGGTGVFPEFQGLGLRKMAQRPRCWKKFFGSARTRGLSAPATPTPTARCLRINQQLGFRPYLSRTEWQVDTGKSAGLLRLCLRCAF